MLLLTLLWVAQQAAQAGRRYDGHTLIRVLEWASGGEARDRVYAHLLLGQLGPEATPDLIRALEARDSFLRVWWNRLRARLLRQPDQPSSFPAINQVAAEILGRFGPTASNAAPALLRWGLRSGNPDAVRHLQALGPAATPHLLSALRNGPRPLRGLAVAVVTDPRFQPVAETLNPVLLELLAGPDAEMRRRAIIALAQLNPHSPAMAERLAALLAEREPATVRCLLQAFRIMGPAARAVAGQIESYLEAPEPELRLAAAQALRAVRPPAKEIVPVLIRLLRESDQTGGMKAWLPCLGLEWQAIQLLGEMGPEAASAVPELLALLEHAPTHRPGRTPHFAALVLSRIGPAAVEGVVRLLEHPSADVRMNAAAALGNPGAAAAPAVPRLIALLESDNPEEQMAAAVALGRLEEFAVEALAALERLASVPTTQDVQLSHARSAARFAITNITRATRPALTGRGSKP